MKKNIFLLLLIVYYSSLAQEQNTLISKSELLNSGQSSFLILVNSYYPEFTIPTTILNIYDSEKQIVESQINYNEVLKDCYDYLITLKPNNSRLDFEFYYSIENGNFFSKGIVYVLGADVYKVIISVEGKTKSFFQLYKNGKKVNTK